MPVFLTLIRLHKSGTFNRLCVTFCNVNILNIMDFTFTTRSAVTHNIMIKTLIDPFAVVYTCSLPVHWQQMPLQS